MNLTHQIRESYVLKKGKNRWVEGNKSCMEATAERNFTRDMCKM